MTSDVQPEELVSLFAANVRARRLKLKLTQAELAARMGVHVPYISAIENGHRTPFLGNLAKFAEALETTPDALISASKKISA